MNDSATVSLDGARARLNAGDVSEVAWMTWDVAGDPERGDSLAFYLVWFNSETGRYQCACHASMIEERVCEHVVAVILYRGTHPDNKVGGEWNPDHVPNHSQADLAGVVLANETPSTLGPIRSPRDIDWGVPPFPDWVSEFRNHQWDAAVSVVEAFAQGSRVVFLDAPTGSGKTLIGEMVRRMMNTRALYLCSDKQLQDQFARDFDYAQVLKGRANYPTLNDRANEQGITAADCDKHVIEGDVRMCSYCFTRTHDCPYEIAKRDALRADLAVLNSTYFLTEANNVGKFAEERDKESGNLKRRSFVIVDECDVLESELMRFVEFYLGEQQLRRLSLTAPKKGSHHKTIAKWLDEELVPACESEASRIPRDTPDIKLRRRRQQLGRMIEEAQITAAELMAATEEEGVLWIRDNDAGPLALKPVRVDRQTPRYLWNHADRWLCMSATVISGDVEAQSLGLNEAGIPWTVVKVPMTFDVINRPIYAAPCADMSWKGKGAGSWVDCVKAIRGLLRRHPEERVLIHAVSYALAAFLVDQLSDGQRQIVSYKNAGERTRTLQIFRETPSGVLIAPSMERGVDLKDDACRVIIVAKVPYPNVSDKAVSARMRQGRDGDVWYAVQTIRALVQMTGRAVRSQDDWAYTYIVDSQFLTNLNSKWGHLLPGWWREAMSIINARALLREGE